MKRLMLSLVGAACIATPAYAQTPTPPLATPPPAPPAAPLPSATPASINATFPGPGHRPSGATPAPPKDEEANRVGITGVWEVAIQNTNGVVYTHFKLTQTGNTIVGQYLDESGKKFPLAGTVDGKNVRVVVTMPNGTALVFNGSQDSGTDMVGTLDTAKDLVGFTASYRPKYKWIDNLTPGTGGTGGMPGGIP